MAFEEEMRASVDSYARNHLADDQWHFAYFNFIGDEKLARRLGEEFLAARYIYKLLEGLGVDGWKQKAQIRFQILSYASIYEASLHQLLFVDNADDPKVKKMTEYSQYKEISVPRNSSRALEKFLSHDGKKIIPTYKGIGRTDQTKVRFDRKAECACELGMIETWLRDDLIEFYEARNSIHIHAEIRKNLEYELKLSALAYWRMQPFRNQIIKWQSERAQNTLPLETNIP